MTMTVPEADKWRVFARQLVSDSLTGPYVFQSLIEGWSFFEFRLRFNDIGTWRLELPIEAVGATWLITDGAGIVVMYEDETVFSGIVQSWEHEWAATDENLIVNGVTDEVWLERRVAHQEPTTDKEASPGLQEVTQYVSDAYDVFTGPCEDALIHYMSFNVGPSALADRQFIAANPASESRGTEVTGRARMQSLLKLLQELAHAGGDLGFRTFIPGTNAAPVFEVYDPADVSDTVVFSPERGNLAEYTFVVAAPEANFVYLAAGQEETDRYFLLDKDAASVTTWGRIEKFADARDIKGAPPDTAETVERVGVHLAEGAEQTSVTATIIGNASGATFPTDWNLGDRVGLSLTRHEVFTSAPVRTVIVQLSADKGISVVAEVGTEALVGGLRSDQGHALRALHARMLNQERR